MYTYFSKDKKSSLGMIRGLSQTEMIGLMFLYDSIQEGVQSFFQRKGADDRTKKSCRACI